MPQPSQPRHWDTTLSLLAPGEVRHQCWNPLTPVPEHPQCQRTGCTRATCPPAPRHCQSPVPGDFARARRALLMPPRTTAGEPVATATWPGNRISSSPQPRGRRTVLPRRPHLCHKEPAAAGACGERKSGISGCPHPVTAHPTTTSRPWRSHQQLAPSGAGSTRQRAEVLASTHRARRGGRDPLRGATGGGRGGSAPGALQGCRHPHALLQESPSNPQCDLWAQS